MQKEQIQFLEPALHLESELLVRNKKEGERGGVLISDSKCKNNKSNFGKAQSILTANSWSQTKRKAPEEGTKRATKGAVSLIYDSTWCFLPHVDFNLFLLANCMP